MCSTTSTTTVALSTVGTPNVSLPSLPMSKTRSNVKGWPASAGTLSTSRVSPAVTRYCLLPISITAYIIPISDKERRFDQKTSIVSTLSHVLFSQPFYLLSVRILAYICVRAMGVTPIFRACNKRESPAHRFFRLNGGGADNRRAWQVGVAQPGLGWIGLDWELNHEAREIHTIMGYWPDGQWLMTGWGPASLVGAIRVPTWINLD